MESVISSSVIDPPLRSSSRTSFRVRSTWTLETAGCFLKWARMPCAQNEQTIPLTVVFTVTTRSGAAALASGTLASHVQHHWVHDAVFFDVHARQSNGVLLELPVRSSWDAP